jgi:deoxyribose-phosphate aldolase
MMDKNNLAAMIDHTLLKPDAVKQEIEKLCREANEYGFFSVCVNPVFVSLSRGLLAGSRAKVCTVIGFPLGANRTDIKLFEAERALFDGADELDMVIALHAVKNGEWDSVKREIASLKNLCKDKILKVILETCCLDDAQIVQSCRIAAEAGADFVKTSTGFSSGGAESRIVRLMRETVGPSLGVKASGGIKSLEAAMSMIESGASRLGTSRGLEILGQL